MEVLIFLLVVLLGLRLAGALGASRFTHWPTCGAYALAAMLVLTGTTHFLPDSLAGGPAPTHADFVPMVPPFVPLPGFQVYLTGALELLGAVGLVLTRTRRPAGVGLAALFVALLPANIYTAVSDIAFNGAPAPSLWTRIPEQLLYIAIALWAAGLLEPNRRRRVGATTDSAR
ncbi:DoxX family protein [Nocardia sp. CA-135398]|uniref:DoxX family protein n=1 Tax=Nocardia sp. CA-135398 TaxID=3239977 RepID=UPI003D9812B6